MDETTLKFLQDIELLCIQYNRSIAHEDHHGAFIIESFKTSNIDWLKDAYTDLDEPTTGGPL